MNDKLRCEFFHEFDGQCCADEECCLYRCDQKIRVIPLDPAPLDSAFAASQYTILCVLLLMIGCLGLFAAVYMDNHYAVRDRIDQEISWQFKRP